MARLSQREGVESFSVQNNIFRSLMSPLLICQKWQTNVTGDHQTLWGADLIQNTLECK